MCPALGGATKRHEAQFLPSVNLWSGGREGQGDQPPTVGRAQSWRHIRVLCAPEGNSERGN